MTNSPAKDQLYQNSAEQLLHMVQLKRVELFNGSGIAQQIGLAGGF